MGWSSLAFRLWRSLTTHFHGSADNWGLENLHGIQTQCFKSKDGTAQHCPTILPVLASAAASFDWDTWRAMGEMLSTEQRASNNNRGLRGNSDRNAVGLNGWGPNINLMRDRTYCAHSLYYSSCSTCYSTATNVSSI